MDWIALAGVIVPMVLAGLGVVAVLARNIQKVGDLSDDVIQLRDELKAQRTDIDRAEAAALEVKSLASAIDALTGRLTDGLGHIGTLFQQQNEHVNTRLEDIKDELRQRTTTTPRRRAAN